MTFLKPNFEIQAFLTHLAFFENKKYQPNFVFYFFQSERLGLGKTLSEAHIHYKSLLMGDHALKIFDVFNKKQTYDNAFTGKENAFKNCNCISSMFLMSFNIYFCLVMHVLYVAYVS